MTKLLARQISSGFSFLKNNVYHFALAFLGALFYGFPSRKLTVIGVTGTKGKTTTANLIAHILETAGSKTGLTTTLNFRIDGVEWVNDTKQTMQGRFALQKLIARMVRGGCVYAIIETSSEGMLQHRHRFIDYRAAVFTNLFPEHVDRHGSFENYRRVKIGLFDKVARRKDGIGVFNLDDTHAPYFLEPRIKTKIGFSVIGRMHDAALKKKVGACYEARDIVLSQKGAEFMVGNDLFKTRLLGEFNVYNALAAIATAYAFHVPAYIIKEALLTFSPPSGRAEIVAARGFRVVIDYAHEPKSLEEIYRTVAALNLKAPQGKMICLLGGQGGGRDTWKRGAMGEIAGAYCDAIVLTNEDPYDEDPHKIIQDIRAGVEKSGKRFSQGETLFVVEDRKEAIEKAISLAHEGDAVVLTGKGGEVKMCVAKGKKIPWNERAVVDEILDKK